MARDLTCRRCGSNDIMTQAVPITKTKRKGLIYWLVFGWWFWVVELLGWLFFGLFMLIPRLFRRTKISTTVRSYAVCQNCGKSWRILRI